MTQTRGQWLSNFALFGILLLALPTVAPAGEFQVEKARSRLVGQRYLLDMQINYRFSAIALEALDNGVPLRLKTEILVRRRNAWFWDPLIERTHLYYQIRYHALSESYQVKNLSTLRTRNFQTRDAAVAALGEFRSAPFLEKDQLEPDEEYEIHLRSSLIREDLPLPIRPLAYFNPSWNLSSGWSRWPLTQ